MPLLIGAQVVQGAGEQVGPVVPGATQALATQVSPDGHVPALLHGAFAGGCGA